MVPDVGAGELLQEIMVRFSRSRLIPENEKNDISINKNELDLLVANMIPTSRHFEIRFDYLQKQVDDLKEGQKAYFRGEGAAPTHQPQTIPP